ncbi:MAG TPA: hypothetical protein VK993_09405 [Chthoniobacterales bacterium]|nr:hypothetical protein [Chthoniobacterales bacterium]
MRSIPAETDPRRVRILSATAIASFFLFALALLAARALPRGVSRDEEQFVSAGALLLREGLLPYVDYPYFHVPNLAFIYAALFAVSDHLLLIARSFNVLCGFLTLVLLFALTARELRDIGQQRLWIAGTAATALLASPLFRLTSGNAWNHDLAVLAALAGFAALVHASNRITALRWIAIAGILLGIAIGTRLSFLPLLAAFVGIVAAMPGTGRERIIRGGVLALFILISLAPTLVLCARAPAQFFFDNFVYNSVLNRAYRLASGNSGVQLPAKLLFGAALLKFPHNVALLTAFAYVAIWIPARSGWRKFLKQRKVVAALLCVPFLWVGAFTPSPSYKQYYYALVPFVIIATAFALAHACRSNGARAARPIWNILAAVSVLALITDLPLLRHLASPDKWPPLSVHKSARELRAHTSGPVLTLSPILPLEGGLGIYKEFATGQFAWRTAAFLPEAAKAKFAMVDAAGLEGFLAAAPPAAIVAPDRGGERNRALTAYAQSHGYRALPLREDVNLWVKP